MPLLIPYKTSSSLSTETTSAPESASLSSTPSPSHHAPLAQIGTDSHSMNVEVDIMTKEEKSQGVVKDITHDVEGSSLAAAEVKGQESVALPQVKGQNDVQACEGKGQNDVIPNEMSASTVTLLNSRKEAANEVARNGVPNGHLLAAEHQNGLILNDNCGGREFANMLTQQPSSLVSVIEMKDLAHIEGTRLHNDEDRPHTVPPTVTPPVVNGMSKASMPTLATVCTYYRSNSEPILSKRTATNRFGSGSNDDSDNKCRNGILHVEPTVTSKPAIEKETGFTGKTEDANAVMMSSIEDGKTDNRFALGVDGLPCSLDPQKRECKN